MVYLTKRVLFLKGDFMKKKVVVGLSGGVDSSVAAYLLKEQGYDVIGVTMEIWKGDEGQTAIADAKAVAEVLGIPHYVMKFHDDFQEKVVDYFVSEYERGYTPNPCNMCNRKVKWEALLQRAKELGVDCVATGHYAQIMQLENGRYTIQNSVTATKDQTYALYNLTQNQLEHTLMPIGAYAKDEIRKIAEKANIPVAGKSDSQDICFIPDGDYAGFIERETGHKYEAGNFVDMQGNVLGQHKGIIFYTVGQRKGLGLTAPTPLFVKELRPDTNEVVICKNEELFEDTCYVSQMNYMAIEGITEPIRAIGKVRYSHKGSPCTLSLLENGMVKCTFDEPQRAMTPGQAAVFYDGDHVLCGGTIEKL